jgi:hypothetical protein
VNNSEGVDVFAEDWDTLVVLDACRYDMFESTSQLPGTLSSRVSKGSSTVEWLQANFDGRDLTDTVYVTANPQLRRNRDKWDVNLHETINVWLEEGWDDETGTVRAERMTQAAIEAHNNFPNKRIVVHYMQPHYPFVPFDTTLDKEHLSEIDESDSSMPDKENVWDQKFLGEISATQNELWNMYVGNLEYALEHVQNLFHYITGKIVITSDHGNYVGEQAHPIPITEYGHPRGLYGEPTVYIPWLECENGDRRKIQPGSGSESIDDVDSEIVTDRLENLGYR